MKLSKTLACLLMALSLTACGTVGPKGDKGDPGTPGQTGPQGPQGPAGQDGTDGQDGKDGADGLPGTDGATWLTGENNPSNDEGKNGDLYLNTLTFDIFLKTNDVWNKIGNIKGKDGADGQDGKDGVNGQDGKDGVNGQDGKDGTNGLPGTDGATWLTGVNDPSNEEGKNGDLYLNTTTSDIFTKVDGEWTKIGNIKGNTGENGHDAETYGRVHTVTFDAGEGHLVNYEESVEVNYGETIELPLAERNEYIFTGWYTGFGVNDGKFTNATPVTRDLTLYAGWEEDIKFYVYFNTNEGSSITPQAYTALSTINSLPEPTKADYTFAGWYLDEELNNRFTAPYIITSDVNVYAKWEIKHYVVSFNVNGGNPLDPVEFTAGDIVSGLTDATKEYKTFAGWYLDSTFTTPLGDDYEIHSNITLYAKYNDTYSKITFISNGGTSVSDKNVMNGTSVTSLSKPSKTDYLFVAWCLDEDLNNEIELPYLITEDVTLYAKWELDPWREYTKITSLSQLKNISDMTGKYVLMNDINCNNEKLTQFGSVDTPFSGEFNGNGHTISSFTVSRTSESSEDYLGLFCVNTGLITDLKINCNQSYGTIKVMYVHSYILGGLVAVNKGTIRNCSVGGTVSLTLGCYGKFYAGGIAGQNIENAEISNCVYKGTMNLEGTGDNNFNVFFGGVSGINTGSTISKCAYTGNYVPTYFTNNGRVASGIAYDGVISNCIVIGNLAGGGTNCVARIAWDNSSTLTSCYYYGDMTFAGTNRKDHGTSLTKQYINAASTYSSSLKFSNTIWNYTGLNYDNGIYVDLL